MLLLPIAPDSFHSTLFFPQFRAIDARFAFLQRLYTTKEASLVVSSLHYAVSSSVMRVAATFDRAVADATGNARCY